MAKQVWRERIIAWLEAYGWTRDYTPPQSSKFVKYSMPEDTTAGYYHVGKAGSVHRSTNGAITHSVTVTDSVKRKVELFERQRELDSCTAKIDSQAGF